MTEEAADTVTHDPEVRALHASAGRIAIVLTIA
jgi:hypothetical protein